MIYQLEKREKNLKGEITLDGSKSISNRVLLIRALCEENFEITNLSTSKDTQTLNELFNSQDDVLDAGAAGTTFRFLTAYLALQNQTSVLTGSSRMKERPIGKLVEALKDLGADISYLEKKGFPPLKISQPKALKNSEISIDAGISSQYISALLMIGPCLPNGLKLKLNGTIVSRPYIEMTLKLMAYFNVKSAWTGNTITVAKQEYAARAIRIESDWSGASYYYALAAFSDEVDVQLNGLFSESIQGDSVIADIMKSFGVKTQFNSEGIRLTKGVKQNAQVFKYNFIRCPDLAQTLAVVCAGSGTKGEFSGLGTLKIKETDRVQALKIELGKIGVEMSPSTSSVEFENDPTYTIQGKPNLNSTPRFQTYEDHRMALAFATLSILAKVEIVEPEVVVKSYGQYWKDLKSLGFEIIPIS